MISLLHHCDLSSSLEIQGFFFLFTCAFIWKEEREIQVINQVTGYVGKIWK